MPLIYKAVALFVVLYVSVEGFVDKPFIPALELIERDPQSKFLVDLRGNLNPYCVYHKIKKKATRWSTTSDHLPPPARTRS